MSLFILKTWKTWGFMYSTVLYGRNAWNSAIHNFFLWFTDILANLDMQTELQIAYTSEVLKKNDTS